MNPTSIAVMLGLLGLGGVYLASKSEILPPEQGEYALTDSELYSAIIGEGPGGTDVMKGMTFSEAVNCDPRRIEALLMQRIVQPLVLAAGRLHSPGVPMAHVEQMARVGYLRMMAHRRTTGGITADRIANSLIDAWTKVSEVFSEAPKQPRFAPVAAMLQGIIVANMRDISRAFREAKQICCQAEKAAASKADALAYGKMCAMLDSMQTGLFFFASAGRKPSKNEVIDDELGLDVITAEEAMRGMGEDLFGALELDEAIVDVEDEYGRFEFEEHIITGHRAPAVSLAQYRRMGGRFY